ncbi:carbohydrate kinase family protein [Candidatus Uhrbacteria bacterium]|nr:carbohydrate kinase family protein [Candidatus Uhrbacteria bacterium]
MPAKKKKYKYDIISVGDATLDSFVKMNSASLLCNLNKENCWLCFTYADKIPIDELHFSMGGNACNNAVGSSRLGLKAAFYSVIGGDDSGRRIVDQVKREGVSPEYLVEEKNKPTNYSVVLNYKTERTILVYHHKRSYALPVFAPSRWIYLTSMGEGFKSIHKELLRFMKKNGTKLAFNPGTHQLLAGRKALEPILLACDLLILNREEGLMLLGLSADTTIQDLLRAIHKIGPDIVVVTDGAKGAYAFDGHRNYYMKTMPAKVEERTGAGDSFSTGFIASLIYGCPLNQALQWGTANAASVIEHIGPQAGLLTKNKLLARIKRSHCDCKEL